MRGLMIRCTECSEFFVAPESVAICSVRRCQACRDKPLFKINQPEKNAGIKIENPISEIHAQ